MQVLAMFPAKKATGSKSTGFDHLYLRNWAYFLYDQLFRIVSLSNFWYSFLQGCPTWYQRCYNSIDGKLRLYTWPPAYYISPVNCRSLVVWCARPYNTNGEKNRSSQFDPMFTNHLSADLLSIGLKYRWRASRTKWDEESALLLKNTIQIQYFSQFM